MNGSNTELDSYLESYHDKYLYDLLHRYERTILGSNALASSVQDEHLVIDINIQFNYPMEIQVLSSEPSKPQEATSQSYFMVSRLSLQPQTLQLLRSQYMSSFSGFGIEFESTNRAKVLQLFCRQLYSSMMSFYRNPTVFAHVRGDLIYARIREILREKIILRKQLTTNFKFKNLDSGHQIFDNGFDLQSPRERSDRSADADRTPQSHANISGLKKKAKGPSQVSYSVSLHNAAKNNTLNIPALQQANSIKQQPASSLSGLSGAGAKTGDVDDHELLDLGDDDDDGPN